MHNWIYGFFMAWGMFLAIPCPFPQWDEKARGNMMVCFPLVGGIVGGIWVLAAWLLREAPAPARALVLAVIPWLLTGFMHLDGFMDVCDAVLSRRSLETRRKILKDSHCGAFAVIGMVLLGLAQWSAALCAEEIPYLPLLLVPVAVRASASLAVMLLRPMETSQYSGMAYGKMAVPACAVLLVLSVGILPWFYGTAGLAPLAAAVVYWLSVWREFRQLDGMNGDISGFALTLGELAGLAVVCLAG